MFLDRLIDWHDGTTGRIKSKTAPGALTDLDVDDVQIEQQIEGPAQYLFKVNIQEICIFLRASSVHLYLG